LGSCNLYEAGRSHQVIWGCRQVAREAVPFVDGCAAFTAARSLDPGPEFLIPVSRDKPSRLGFTRNPDPEMRNPKPNGFGACPRRPSSFVLV
jgi:hypothetical protein